MISTTLLDMIEFIGVDLGKAGDNKERFKKF
jgi:hypothetical protein